MSAHVLAEEDGRDQHRQADGDAVGGGEVRRRLVLQDQADRAEHQHPVDDRDVDLAGLLVRSAFDAHPRQVVQLNRLHRRGESARDQGLRGDDGGEGGDHDQRDLGPGRRHVEEGAGVLGDVRGRLGERPGTLAEVVQDEGGEDDEVPARTDRLLAEVSHVGVEGFGTGHREEDGAEDEHAKARLGVEETDGLERVEGVQNHRGLRCMGDQRTHAGDGDTDEPDQGHRSEIHADPARAPLL